MRARVEIGFRPGVLDPEAQAIGRALGSLGFSGVRGVRRTKVIELDLDARDREAAEAEVKAMCERLLANTLIEDFEVLDAEPAVAS